MIMTVNELRQHITTDKEDQALEARLQALELLIRGYTNNNFQERHCRRDADIVDGTLTADTTIPFQVGDTVQISSSDLNDGLYTIREVDFTYFTLNEPVQDEKNVLVTRVEYPMDVKMGVVNLLQWELKNREKVGVQSETISRHSVTYYNMDGENAQQGYPKSMMGFLEPHMKARFGRGIRV